MPQAGIEPTTLALGVLCSVHLSYWGLHSDYSILHQKMNKKNRRGLNALSC
jgi:hypothetical protein